MTVVGFRSTKSMAGVYVVVADADLGKQSWFSIKDFPTIWGALKGNEKNKIVYKQISKTPREGERNISRCAVLDGKKLFVYESHENEEIKKSTTNFADNWVYDLDDNIIKFFDGIEQNMTKPKIFDKAMDDIMKKSAEDSSRVVVL